MRWFYKGLHRAESRDRKPDQVRVVHIDGHVRKAIMRWSQQSYPIPEVLVLY